MDRKISVGVLLKERRDELGLTPQEVSFMTKLNTRFILALEQDNFKIFDSTYILKHYLNSYGKILKMDLKLLLMAYKEQVGDREVLECNLQEVTTDNINTSRIVLWIAVTILICSIYLIKVGLQKFTDIDVFTLKNNSISASYHNNLRPIFSKQKSSRDILMEKLAR
jgi:cytoskeletal protein RodZ